MSEGTGRGAAPDAGIPRLNGQRKLAEMAEQRREPPLFGASLGLDLAIKELLDGRRSEALCWLLATKDHIAKLQPRTQTRAGRPELSRASRRWRVS